MILTKRQFDRLMVKGWKEQKKGFMRHQLSNDTRTKFCAMGIVGSQIEGLTYVSPFGYLEWHLKEAQHAMSGMTLEKQWEIINANNSSKTKNEAMRKIKAIQW